MRNDVFQTQYEQSQKKLRFHKRFDFTIRLLTLGMLDNSKNLDRCEDDLKESSQHLKEYDELISDSINNDIIEIFGVRVSKHCFSDLSVIKPDDYGINWDNLRDEVLTRDGFECQESNGCCNGPLQVHHKLPLSKGGSNDLNNLVTLCLFHHSLKHPHMRR